MQFFGQFSSDFIWHSSERKPKLGFPQNKIICRKPIATSWSRSCCTLLSKSSRCSELGRAPEFYFCPWVRISFSPARSLSWFFFSLCALSSNLPAGRCSTWVFEQSSGRSTFEAILDLIWGRVESLHAGRDLQREFYFLRWHSKHDEKCFRMKYNSSGFFSRMGEPACDNALVSSKIAV